MKCVTKYDPLRDVVQVSNSGFVDLVKANQTSQIDVPLALSEEHFNGIDDPKSIVARPSDVFETMQANRAIVDYKPAEQGTSE